MTPTDHMARLLPGVSLCAAVSLTALGLARLEEVAFGRAWLETLVLAILLGCAIRTAWRPGPRWKPGIDFSAKMLLEVGVVLLGASLSAATILAVGWELLLGIAVVVGVAIPASYGLGRAFGLAPRLAVLVACGNSICGNSAIAAVAPVVGAKGEDVAASIAFTAVLGVVVVLILPLLAPLLGLSAGPYGVLAGLTVYAVPQVLAATAPLGGLAVQIGTLVKLVRVLMLGPVVVALSLLTPRQGAARPPLSRLVPWFILGFLGLAALRSLELLPAALLGPMATVATALTVLAMAALGLGVDVRTVARAGGRVVGAAVASLLLLGVVSLGLIRVLGVG
ncbi:YeiH family protein [Pararoseomonas indoligenes]|uniref:Sulfate exporter family transporter n=1 Tax=Roseomonas indoligenes TaxID=2820811 RepID=A0A940S579_9PROT|nr:putative sulfate exporter family transporter [Pararoseomonas indoligenes]MBP0494111.1 putative sulfate exporter family transporter [Pararoseomonas indoligenes]